VLGAGGDGKGQAYIYKRTNGAWNTTPVQELKDINPLVNTRFGDKADMFEDCIVVRTDLFPMLN
jgi:hypothetical protein